MDNLIQMCRYKCIESRYVIAPEHGYASAHLRNWDLEFAETARNQRGNHIIILEL